MKVISWAEVGHPGLHLAPVSATIGVFDGVHRGHQALFEEMARGPEPRPEILVVTFRENPKKILNPAYPGHLMSWNEKVSALADHGVSLVVAIDFSPAFSTIPGRDFFLALKRSFVFSKLVLGWDFSFGKDSSTTVADLGWLADPETRLTVLPPFTLDGEVVSSTAVRKAIAAGDLGRARSLLGRPYTLPLEQDATWIDGRCVVSRAAMGKLLPPVGSYPARLDGRETIIMVENDHLSWESPPGIRFQQIVFV